MVVPHNFEEVTIVFYYQEFLEKILPIEEGPTFVTIGCAKGRRIGLPPSHIRRSFGKATPIIASIRKAKKGSTVQ